MSHYVQTPNDNLLARTKAFALQIIRMFATLPKTTEIMV